MAMVVKNNMSAINTLNILNKNSSALSKSLQKVSSGMKINGAADDASGYAISERMRVQIRSLDQANQNTQNGSSMMKTAEGAVSSTVDILKTLKEKVINAANDTNTDADRATIQKELDQSIDQIDDNANITFNGKYLVDGSKNTVGNATYTALSNQNLAADTTGTTTLTGLKSRSGDSLELSSTDKLTVSYVQGGKTFSTTFDVGTKKLQDVFIAAEQIDTSSNIFANKGNDSVAAANGLSDTEKTTAKTDATSAQQTYNSAKGTFDTLTNTLTTTRKDVADKVTALKTAVATYNAGAATADKITTDLSSVTDDFEYLSQLSTDAKFPAFIVDTTHGGKAAFDNVKTAVTAYSGATYTANTTVATLTDATTGGALKAYTDGKGVYDAAVIAYAASAAAPALLTGAKIGLAASNDMVSTADGTNAITITANAAGIGGQISGFNISVKDSQGNVKKSANASLDAWGETIRAQNKSDDNAITLQVGAKANQSIKIGLTDMRSEALGLKGADGTKLNISTQTKANAAVNVLDNALQKALDQQTTIGSVESRLEYTSSNLTTASTNVQSSESTIRDADMAKEMTEYTKNNVLLQAAQSMLAQANQNSSSVLSLLK